MGGGWLGWVLVIGGAILLVLALRRPKRAPAGSAAAANETADFARRRRQLTLGAIAGLVIGGYLLVSTTLARAHLRPRDLSHPDDWVRSHTDDRIEVLPGPEIRATLEVGSNVYAVIPVDWNADRFRAEWDLILTRLDVRERQPEPGEDPGPNSTIVTERASIAIGLMDQNAASIDDRDHVGGSGLQACFSDDIRLRGSDVNNLLKTASSDESGKTIVPKDFRPRPRVDLRPYLHQPLHCVLEYDGDYDTARLRVTTADQRVLADLRLEDLRDFTNTVQWFGITVKGYNRWSKQAEYAWNRRNAELKRRGLPDQGPYPKPRAECVIRNLRYSQP